jgi:hypothetical protein
MVDHWTRKRGIYVPWTILRHHFQISQIVWISISHRKNNQGQLWLYLVAGKAGKLSIGKEAN